MNGAEAVNASHAKMMNGTIEVSKESSEVRRTSRSRAASPEGSRSHASRFVLRLATIALGVAIAFTTIASTAKADLDAFLTLTLNGSPVMGDVTLAGREGTIRVRALSMGGFSSVAPSGATGPAKSRPVTFLMDVDRSTAQIFAAWANSSVVNEAIFRLYEPNQFGAEINTIELTLTNGRVSSYVLNSPDSLDPNLASRPATILVGFTYASAELTHVPTGNSQTIPWQTGP